jgi:hypothetical protein
LCGKTGVIPTAGQQTALDDGDGQLRAAAAMIAIDRFPAAI